MSRLILITDWFDKYDRNGYRTGEKELLVSYAVDEDSGETVVAPNNPITWFDGAMIDTKLNEYVLENK